MKTQDPQSAKQISKDYSSIPVTIIAALTLLFIEWVYGLGLIYLMFHVACVIMSIHMNLDRAEKLNRSKSNAQLCSIFFPALSILIYGVILKKEP